jgi:hypothetical protein
MSVNLIADSIRPELVHVIWKPHNTQQSMGAFGEPLKEKRIFAIRDLVISGKWAILRLLYANHIRLSPVEASREFSYG